jgi:hypothetical protein
MWMSLTQKEILYNYLQVWFLGDSNKEDVVFKFSCSNTIKSWFLNEAIYWEKTGPKLFRRKQFLLLISANNVS